MIITLAANALIALCLKINASFSPETTDFIKFPMPSDLYSSQNAMIKFRSYFFIFGLLSDSKLDIILHTMLLLKLSFLLCIIILARIYLRRRSLIYYANELIISICIINSHNIIHVHRITYIPLETIY